MGGQGPPHRIGEGRHRPDAGGHVGNPALGQAQAVLHHRGDGVLGRRQVQGVGRQNGGGVRLQGVGHGQKNGFLLLGGEGGQGGLGRQRLLQQGAGDGQLGGVGSGRGGKFVAAESGRRIAGHLAGGGGKIHGSLILSFRGSGCPRACRPRCHRVQRERTHWQ